MLSKKNSASLASSAITHLRGSAHIPGDKSISHRSLMLPALASGTSIISGLLEGEDVLATAAAMRLMGAKIDKREDGTWRVQGVGLGKLKAPSTTLEMGNSGTSTRLLMGLVASHPISATFAGDDSLSKRPMSRVSDPLAQAGATIDASQGDKLPLTITGSESPKPLDYTPPMASAQVKSAVLFAGLNTDGTTIVREKTPTRDHSERLLKALGADISVEPDDDGGRIIKLTGKKPLSATDIIVPGDISSAAFPMAAAAMTEGSDITLKGVGLNPLRTGIIDALKALGADIRILNIHEAGGEPVGDIHVLGSKLKGIDGLIVEPSTMIDEFPVLFCAAAVAKGTTRLTGLHELRVKESDRLAVMAEGLRASGIEVEEFEDGLTIRGCGDDDGNGKVPGGATIKTHLDHRIAMSFLVLGMMAKEPIAIDDASAFHTSFPTFSDLMNELGGKIR